jgi:hypothetical protein
LPLFLKMDQVKPCFQPPQPYCARCHKDIKRGNQRYCYHCQPTTIPTHACLNAWWCGATQLPLAQWLCDHCQHL